MNVRVVGRWLGRFAYKALLGVIFRNRRLTIERADNHMNH